MPALETITLAKGGTAERTVRLAELTIPDIRPAALKHPKRKWRDAIGRYYRDVCALLFAARVGADYPASIWIPDLWFAQNGLRKADAAAVHTAWHIGHDLAKSLRYFRLDCETEFADAAGAPGFRFHRAEEVIS